MSLRGAERRSNPVNIERPIDNDLPAGRQGLPHSQVLFSTWSLAMTLLNIDY